MKIIPFIQQIIQQKLAGHNEKISNTLSILPHIAKTAPKQTSTQLQPKPKLLRGTVRTGQEVQLTPETLQQPQG
jgi:septum formation inhibitor MinC